MSLFSSIPESVMRNAITQKENSSSELLGINDLQSVAKGAEALAEDHRNAPKPKPRTLFLSGGNNTRKGPIPL